MSSITHRRPFDAETEASMNAIAEQLPVITPEMIASLREAPLPVSFSEELLAEHDAVAVSVEYRLAPEFPDPCPVEDCYAGLV
ncbi:alpha/beta hydrolase, partial [Neisseria gonorrhoeae]|uniref:alpha/beta hydrolase n=1 Tax=Neisseria gonorrhoeae TaxID=485 RepID=UPI00311F0E46